MSKNLPLLFLLILGGLLINSPSAGAQDEASPLKANGLQIRIFVLTGQSNSLGTTADKKDPDITPGKNPLDAQIPFFWANRSTRAGDGSAVLYDDSDQVTTRNVHHSICEI